MKNKELFENTVAILAKAYLTNELESTDCARCAVGNLVMSGMEYKYIGLNQWKTKEGLIQNPKWNYSRSLMSGTFNKGFYYGISKKEIDSTGYTPEQLIMIEHVFMKYKWLGESNDYNYNGLMGVVDYLMTIHEANEQEITEAKQLFTINN